MLIPGFAELKKAANEAGALGTGISGSGPSVFALSKGEGRQQKMRDWPCRKFMTKLKFPTTHTSGSINITEGVKIPVILQCEIF